MTTLPSSSRSASRLPWLSLVVLFALLLVACIPLLPFDDDLYYISPVAWFDPAGLLPRADQWRPIDYLFRVMLGWQPSLYPLANHVMVVLGHVANLALFAHICTRFLGVQGKYAAVATALFAISPAVAVAVFSIDSLNQVWSMAFGLVACVLLMKGASAPRGIAAIACCWIAVFWKESGITFFVVAPLAGWAVSRFESSARGRHVSPPAASSGLFATPGQKGCVVVLAVGIVCCIAYFAMRFALLGSAQLGTSGRYAMSLSPGHIVRNLAVMVGVNLSSADSIAVLLSPRNILLAAATFAAGLPLLAWVVYASVKSLKERAQRFALLILGLIALVAISPYLVMGSAGEMHAYQFTPFYAAGIALLLKWREPSLKSWFALVLAAFVAASLVTDAHKWMGMKAMGDSTLPVYEAVAGAYEGDEHPQVVTGFAIESGDEPLYSVFSMTVSDASEAGQVAAARWGWRWPSQFECVDVAEDVTVEELQRRFPDKFANSDGVWIVTHDGSVTVLKQGEDY